ncbi:cell envelope integrity protein TolA [Terracidiphilus sp.]|jgi:periplasmic protein TonB|uniref:cell envelope integrity protein TolA n=1 Tax=Terracidiphilus sp. TaxID=1964191 RepID=UPI003C1320B4
MSNLLESEEHLEQELAGEPFAAPATGSVLLHAGLAALVVVYAVAGGFFHSNNWGGATIGGAIQVNVTNTIPLPNTQPPNENVLATEKPSPAPAPPAPKAAPQVDEKAIPIQGKPERLKQQKPAPKATPSKQPPPPPTNRAQYGEQAANNLPRAIQGQQTVNGPVNVKGSDFGSMFPYYIQGIQRKMAASSSMQLVDPRTPKGTKAFILFTIHKDGTLSDVQMDKSSGSPSLDRECLRAAQRVDSFGPLPPAYNGSTVITSYYCEF